MFSSTDYHRLQQIMDESPEKQELLSRLLAEHQITISTISHEIRNPLTLVSGALQLIEAEHPEVLYFRYWPELLQDIEYMNLLLNELSTYNNSERIRCSTIDANTFFKTLALSFATTLIDTKIQFISHIPHNLPALFADALKLKEVFLNLLGNARDAVSDVPEPVIHLTIQEEPHLLKILITDNGCGISAEKLPHIFEPFITHKSNGTGLGLAIASRVIHSHQGTIHAESVPFIRTVFTVSLPIQKNS